MKNNDLIKKMKNRISQRYAGQGLVMTDTALVSTIKPLNGKNNFPISILSRNQKNDQSGDILLDQADAFYPYGIQVWVHAGLDTDGVCKSVGFPQTFVSDVFRTNATESVNDTIVDSLHNLAYAGFYRLVKGALVMMEDSNQYESLYVVDGGDPLALGGVHGFDLSKFGKELEITTPLKGEEQILMNVRTTSDSTTYQDTSRTDGKSNFITVRFAGILVKGGGTTK